MHSSVPSLLSSLLLHHSARNVRCLLTCLHMTVLNTARPLSQPSWEHDIFFSAIICVWGVQKLDSSTACWVMMSMPVYSYFHRALSKHAALWKVDKVARSISIWNCVPGCSCVTAVPSNRLQAGSRVYPLVRKKMRGRERCGGRWSGWRGRTSPH